MASYRPITTEIAAPTSTGDATNVSDANIVRVVNTSDAPQLITVQKEDGTITGSQTLVPNEVFFLKKHETDEIFAASNTVKLTRITYPVM